MSDTTSGNNEGRIKWDSPYGKVWLREFESKTIEGIRIQKECSCDTYPLVLSSGVDERTGGQIMWVHFSNRGVPICFNSIEEFGDWLAKQVLGRAGLVEFGETGL